MTDEKKKTVLESRRTVFLALGVVAILSSLVIVTKLVNRSAGGIFNSIPFNILVGFCVISLLAVIVIACLYAFTNVFAPETQENLSASNFNKVEKQRFTSAFKIAIKTLKKSRRIFWGDTSYRYILPWYMVTGLDKSGKTTFIQNSGLNIPSNKLTDRNIDIGNGDSIFICDHLVLLDTAVPFASQEKQFLSDHLYELLKKIRPTQPLNGVIFLIDINRIISGSLANVAIMGQEAREHISRLQEDLGVAPPIYVVFTHLDAVPGFTAFFQGTAIVPKNQPYGITLPVLSDGERMDDESTVAQLDQKFDEFVQWQKPWMFERIAREFIPQTRYEAFIFQTNFMMLKPKILKFVEKFISIGELDDQLFFRGIYFVNSIPPKTMATINQSAYNVADGSPQKMRQGEEGYFIKDLMELLIIEERDLVGFNEKVKLYYSRLWSIIFATFVITSFSLLLWFLISFGNNNHLIDNVIKGIDGVKKEFLIFSKKQSEATASAEVLLSLPVLKLLEDIPTGWNDTVMATPFGEKAGLSQRNILSQAAINAYIVGLHNIFLPIITSSIEDTLRDPNIDQPTLYDNLMVYLMMCGQHEVEKKIVYEVLTADFARSHPGVDYTELRGIFSHNLENLLAVTFEPRPFQKKLAFATREKLKSFSPALHGFSLLQRQTEIQKLDPWRLNEALGPLGPVSIRRRSGKPIYDAVPGLYTANNFNHVVLPAIANIARTIVKEDWVLFNRSERDKPNITYEKVRGEIISLYVMNYIDVWEALLNDLTFASFSDFKKELVILQSLSGPPSPIEGVLTSISKETTLVEPNAQPAESNPEKAEDSSNKDAIFVFDEKTAKQRITKHFFQLNSFVKGAPSALSEMLRAFNQIRSLIGPIAINNSTISQETQKLTANTPLGESLEQLQRVAISAPVSVADSIDDLVRKTTVLMETLNKIDVDSAWKDNIYKFCKAAINDRYPFTSSSAEVTLGDFTKTFAPDGILDQFFQQYVRTYTDTSTSPWRLLVNTESKLEITPHALSMFEQANRIKTVFFPAGSKEPRISFSVEPTDLDIKAKGLNLFVGEQTLSYQYGIQQATPMVWPSGNNNVRVNFTNVQPGEPTSLTIDGPWAFFHLLQRQQFERQSPTQFNLHIAFSGRYASFLVTASTVTNAFQKNVLKGFKCVPSITRN